MWLDEWRLFQLFTIQQGLSKLFSSRHPSSASLAGSEVPSSLAASPRGKPRGSCGSWFHSTFCTVPSANGRLRRSGRQVGDPYNGYAKPGACTIQRSTLPQPRFAQQLPQRGSQGCFAPENCGSTASRPLQGVCIKTAPYHYNDPCFSQFSMIESQDYIKIR